MEDGIKPKASKHTQQQPKLRLETLFRGCTVLSLTMSMIGHNDIFVTQLSVSMNLTPTHRHRPLYLGLKLKAKVKV
jgi:hypothetical protein